jgi:hypothetical protein
MKRCYDFGTKSEMTSRRVPEPMFYDRASSGSSPRGDGLFHKRAAAFLLVTSIATKEHFFFLQESAIR